MQCIGKAQRYEEMCASESLFTECFYLSTELVYLYDDVMLFRELCDVHHIVDGDRKIDEKYSVEYPHKKRELQILQQHINGVGDGRIQEKAVAQTQQQPEKAVHRADYAAYVAPELRVVPQHYLHLDDKYQPCEVFQRCDTGCHYQE